MTQWLKAIIALPEEFMISCNPRIPHPPQAAEGPLHTWHRLIETINSDRWGHTHTRVHDTNTSLKKDLPAACHRKKLAKNSKFIHSLVSKTGEYYSASIK